MPPLKRSESEPDTKSLQPAGEPQRVASQPGGSATDRDRQRKLTPRECEVLRLIALGHTSVEIAEKLSLSPRTIETHRARIHRKLGVSKRSELVSYALQHDMLRL